MPLHDSQYLNQTNVPNTVFRDVANFENCNDSEASGGPIFSRAYAVLQIRHCMVKKLCDHMVSGSVLVYSTLGK